MCRETFQDGGDHANHRCLQVRKVTRENALLAEDLLGNSSTKPFMTEEPLAQIQQYQANEKPHIKFERQSMSSKAPLSTRLQTCAACKLPISGSMHTNQSTSPVCSMKCFLDHVMTQRMNDLLLPAIPCSNMARDWDDLIGENAAGKGKIMGKDTKEMIICTIAQPRDHWFLDELRGLIAQVSVHIRRCVTIQKRKLKSLESWMCCTLLGSSKIWLAAA